MKTYCVVGTKQLLKPWEGPFGYERELKARDENSAVVAAYHLVRHEPDAGIAAYILVSATDWKNAKARASVFKAGIVIHELNIPVCDACWRKVSKKSQTHYWTRPAMLERCAICGQSTTNALFARFPEKDLPARL
jgi:hypothetical protein